MIRRATYEDIPMLMALGRQFHEEATYAKPAFNEETIRETLVGLIESGAVWIAKGGMIGVLPYREWISGKMIGGELFWWVLNKGNGVGGLLLDAAEEWVQEQGLKKFNLTIPYEAYELQVYLENRGYQSIEIAMTKEFP